MKLKYYLRGLGIGIIVTTIVLMISFSRNEKTMSDDEVIERATQLGMVMPENSAVDTEVMDAEGLLASVNSEREQENADAAKDSQAADDGGAQDERTPAGGTEMQDGQTPEEGENPANDQTPGESENPADGGGNPEDSQTPEDGQTPEGASDAGGADAGTQTGSYHLVIQRGDVCRTVCETLAANGVTSDAEALRRYLFEIGYASSISTGEYDIPYGSSMEEIAAVLQAGPIEQ